MIGLSVFKPSVSAIKPIKYRQSNQQMSVIEPANEHWWCNFAPCRIRSIRDTNKPNHRGNVIKSTHLLLAICLSAHLTGCGSDNDEQPGQPVIDRVEEVVFFDDFTSFNSAYWTKETHEAGWTNQELQSYETSQVTIGKDGDKSVLILTAKRTGDNIVSGRVNSKNKKSFKHGKIEASRISISRYK